MFEQGNFEGKLTPLGNALADKALEPAEFILGRELKDPKIWQEMAQGNRYLTFQHTDWHAAVASEKDGLHAVVIDANQQIIGDVGQIKVRSGPTACEQSLIPFVQLCDGQNPNGNLNRALQGLSPAENMQAQTLASELVRGDTPDASRSAEVIRHERHSEQVFSLANSLADQEAKSMGSPCSPERIVLDGSGRVEIVQQPAIRIPQSPETFIGTPPCNPVQAVPEGPPQNALPVQPRYTEIPAPPPTSLSFSPTPLPQYEVQSTPPTAQLVAPTFPPPPSNYEVPFVAVPPPPTVYEAPQPVPVLPTLPTAPITPYTYLVPPQTFGYPPVYPVGTPNLSIGTGGLSVTIPLGNKRHHHFL